MGRLKATLFAATLLGFSAPQILAQTDIALSGYGAFNQGTSAASVIEHPADQGGFLVEVRHIRNPIVGYEVNYGFNRGNERYSSTNPCALSCTVQSGTVSANTHEITADWVVSLHLLMVRPFALAGGGALATVPQGGKLITTTCPGGSAPCLITTTVATTRTETKGMFNYGAGVDVTVLPHLGLRLQYRGRVSKAPDVMTAFSSTDKFRRTSEPVFGAFLSF